VNVYQGIPDYSTVTAGQTVHLRFNRKPTSHCTDPLNKYPGDKYSVWLYNNPVRDRDTINFDERMQIASGIAESAGVVDVKIPEDLPQVRNDSVWYLRLDTALSTAPQVCSRFHQLQCALLMLTFLFRCLAFTTLLGRLLLLRR